MAFGDMLSSLSSRLRSSNTALPLSEKPMGKISWRKLFGFEQDKAQAARETAWLDGLRGVAAFLVMVYHFHLAWFNPFGMEAPWGAVEGANEIWRLPFFRLWFCSGHTQVSVFFVLSGFVLSWSSLASIRAGRYEKIATGLGSAVFRRWLRLYLPCFAVAGFYMLAFWFHILDIGGLIGVKERESNFFLQVFDWMRANQKFANPFDINRNQWSALHEYEATMWTIPFEFAGSLLVFVVLLATCRIRDYTRRTIITVGVTFYAAADGRWAYWLFAAGIVVADYVRQRGGFAALTNNQSKRSTIIWSLVFIFGLYIGGFPEPSDSWTPVGYVYLTALIPPNWKDIEGGGRFWWCLAGIILIVSISHLSGVRRCFDNRVARYLGRVSYMLYLTHRTCLDLVGHPLKNVILPFFGRKDFINNPPGESFGHQLMTFVVYLIMLGTMVPIALFVAHWVSVFVDEPSVRFAKWVDDIFTRGSNASAAGENGRAHGGEEGARLLQQDTELLPTHSVHGENGSSRYPA